MHRQATPAATDRTTRHHQVGVGEYAHGSALDCESIARISAGWVGLVELIKPPWLGADGDSQGIDMRLALTKSGKLPSGFRQQSGCGPQALLRRPHAIFLRQPLPVSRLCPGNRSSPSTDTPQAWRKATGSARVDGDVVRSSAGVFAVFLSEAGPSFTELETQLDRALARDVPAGAVESWCIHTRECA